MKTELRHYETWALTLEREEHDTTWAGSHLVAGTRTREIRPDKIVINLRGGEQEPTSVLVIGQPLGPDGPRLSMKPVVSRHHSNMPPWLDELVETARTVNDVGRGRTGGTD